MLGFHQIKDDIRGKIAPWRGRRGTVSRETDRKLAKFFKKKFFFFGYPVVASFIDIQK